jgi:hypothetical protein
MAGSVSPETGQQAAPCGARLRPRQLQVSTGNGELTFTAPTCRLKSRSEDAIGLLTRRKRLEYRVFARGESG